MARLLLLAGHFPHRVEFLDKEIRFLASEFEEVTVAPFRPRGEQVVELPGNVEVDYSLAETFAPRWPIAQRYSRKVSALAYAAGSLRMRMPTGAAPLDRAWRNRAFLRESFRTRADAEVIRTWAARRSPPDVAYTFWLGSSAVALRAAWGDVPIASRAHRTDIYTEAHGFPVYPYQHLIVDDADLIACVADDGTRYLREAYPQHADKIVTRHLGIADIGGLSARTSGSTRKVLSVSHMNPVKRVPLIAETVVELARRGTAVHWTHLGIGPELGRVMEIIANAPANFSADLPGFVPQAGVYDTMLNGGFDAFVNLSVSEGAPVSLMEAQCVGLPVLATDVGGSLEVAPPELNRLVSVDLSAPQLVQELKALFEHDPADAQARRRHWQENYSADANYPRWSSELRALAG